MSVPPNFLSVARRLEGFQKNVVQLQPIGGTDFASGTEIIFQFPANILFDAHNTAIAFDVEIASLANGTISTPLLTHAFFSSIDLYINGVQANASADPALWAHIKQALTASDTVRAKSVPFALGRRVVIDANGTIQLLLSELPHLFSGLFRFIDTGILGNVELRLRLKDFARIFEMSGLNTSYQATVRNVRMLMPVLQIAGDPYRALLAQKMASGGLSMPFSNVATYDGAPFIANTQMAVNIAT